MTDPGNTRIRSYRKWTARVALVFFTVAALVGLAMIPLHSDHTTWPLSKHFGHHHVFAAIEILLGWTVVGAAALVVVGWFAFCLLRRAEWIHD